MTRRFVLLDKQRDRQKGTGLVKGRISAKLFGTTHRNISASVVYLSFPTFKVAVLLNENCIRHLALLLT